MLSILIPIYNTDCTKLVTDLQKQCTKSKINYEIICFDDCSKPEFKQKNQILSFLFGVSYVELSENHGRAKIRNLLANNANHEFLLFLDADSKLPNKSFIKNYVSSIERESVLYGGRIYQKNKPGSEKKTLHWLYGTKREALSAVKRNKSPYLNFLSNNFVIPAKLFSTLRFDPEHDGYGYEDTVFATRLRDAGIPIRHTDNPLVHTGLETAEVFLGKSKNALENLVLMYAEGKILDTRLIRFYKFIKKLGLESKVLHLLQGRISRFQQNLFGLTPKLIFFDLWKLYHFMKMLQEKEIPALKTGKK